MPAVSPKRGVVLSLAGVDGLDSSGEEKKVGAKEQQRAAIAWFQAFNGH
jgi:hypothetical protein